MTIWFRIGEIYTVFDVTLLEFYFSLIHINRKTWASAGFFPGRVGVQLGSKGRGGKTDFYTVFCPLLKF